MDKNDMFGIYQAHYMLSKFTYIHFMRYVRPHVEQRTEVERIIVTRSRSRALERSGTP